MAIMLSQIQPHFLYNSLAVIQDLCHDKAPDADRLSLSFHSSCGEIWIP
jgi:sensor histidine kinase YesM